MNKPDFIIIPRQLIENSKLTPLDYIVYGIIYWFTKLKNEKCIASNHLIANLCNANAGSIQNSLNRLENEKCILRRFSDDTKKKRLEIIPLVVFSRVSSTNDTVSSTNDTQVSSTNDQKKNIYNKNNKEDLCAFCFDEFWKLYPNKVNKKKAHNKFSQLSHETHLVILGDLPKRITSEEWTKECGRFVPHPTTYLNGARWEDEIKARTSRVINFNE